MQQPPGLERQAVKSKLVILLMFMLWFSAPALAQEKQKQKSHVCEGTFALCTTAKCSFGTSNDQNVDCVCTVNKGHSAGGKECKDPIQTDQGTKIYSRFFPIGSYQTCPDAPTERQSGNLVSVCEETHHGR
jgi:hypothetical protein